MLHRGSRSKIDRPWTYAHDVDEAAEREWQRRWHLRMGAVAASYWGAVVEMQLRRLERGTEAHRRRELHPERVTRADGFEAAMTGDFGPMQADAYLLIVAVRHLLALADRYAERHSPERVQAARAAFDREAPDAKGIRDVLAHIDAYALGQGRRDHYEAQGQWFIQLGIDDARREFDVRAGRLRVELRRTARAAAALADALTEIASER